MYQSMFLLKADAYLLLLIISARFSTAISESNGSNIVLSVSPRALDDSFHMTDDESQSIS